MKVNSDIRPSPIAGTWYPDNPTRLAELVDSYIQQAQLPPLEGEVIALIAPHAGYRYSGRTAGYAFRAAKGLAPERVVVVSPYHNFHSMPLLTTIHQAYATPLGQIPVDKEMLSALDDTLFREAGMHLTALKNDPEHSLEIELPFLQRSLAGDFQLLPVMVRSQTPALARSLGAGLAAVLRGWPALLVASTDLSHFYPLPTANRLDSEMLRQIADFSPEGVLEAEETGTGMACGVYAVAAVLWAARELGADTVQVLHHSTSAEETGDPSAVVGYGAAVALKQQ